MGSIEVLFSQWSHKQENWRCKTHHHREDKVRLGVGMVAEPLRLEMPENGAESNRHIL